MQHLDKDIDHLLCLAIDSDDERSRFKCLTEAEFDHEISIDPTLFCIRLPFGAGLLYYEQDIFGQYILKFIQFLLNIPEDYVHPVKKWGEDS